MPSGTPCGTLRGGTETTAPAWRNRAIAEQKRKGWEMAVRIEKILCTVLDEAHKRQAEEVMEALSEGPEGFYKNHLD